MAHGREFCFNFAAVMETGGIRALLHRQFKLLVSMLRFALGSTAGTLMDFLLFRFVLVQFVPVFYAELGAAFSGMVVNFYMHKRFVFQMNRKVSSAFLLSVAFSFVAMFIGAWSLSELAQFSFWAQHLTLAKLMVMGCKFGFNYFTKRWVFERYWIKPGEPVNSVPEKR